MGVIVMQTLTEIPAGQVPFPFTWPGCFVLALLWRLLSVFALPSRCANEKHVAQVSGSGPSICLPWQVGRQELWMAGQACLLLSTECHPVATEPAQLRLLRGERKDQGRRDRNCAQYLGFKTKPNHFFCRAGTHSACGHLAVGKQLLQKAGCGILEGGRVNQACCCLIFWSIWDHCKCQHTFEICDSIREHSSSGLVLQFP